MAGKTAHRVMSEKTYLKDICGQVSGRLVQDVSCHGKHIFIDFGDGHILHNHLLMKGRWRKYHGGMLFPPDDAWMAIDLGATTVCNLFGQMMEWVDAEGKSEVVASLGPDVMEQPYPRAAIDAALRGSRFPISEALLDQTLVAGIGNIAKSEILFTAGIDPKRLCVSLTKAEWERLHDRIERILWESYEQGGRWIHRVYRRRGEPCRNCRAPIERIRLAPSRRSTYYCPSCQDTASLSLF